MLRAHVLVEGQTEETIVKQVFAPYYEKRQVYVSCSLLTTKRPAGGPKHKGGVTTWARMRDDIGRLLHDTSLTALTTLVDFYAFPEDAPGMENRPPGTAYEKVRYVESALTAAIGDPRFVPHLVLHETEAWVLAACETLTAVMGGPCAELSQAVEAEGCAELVNDRPETAPSKRILKVFDRYRKTVDGPLVVSDLGLDGVRARCPHAHERLTAFEAAVGIR
jgi:hypothetical protein